MTLGTFQPRQRISGDKLLLNNYIGRPLLVRTNEYVEAFTSQAYPNPKPVVFCDVVDLISGQIFINVLWGGGAVVDNLKEFAGTETIMPVKPGQATGGSGRQYQTLLALEGAEAEAASNWYNTYWRLVDQERAKREAASRPLQAAAPAQVGVQGQPGANLPAPAYVPGPQTQPAQSYQNPAPAQQYAQPLPHDQQGYAAPAAQPQYGSPQGQPMQAPPQQFQQPAQNQPYQGGPQYADPNAGQFAQPQGQPTFGQPPAPAPAGAVQGGFAALMGMQGQAPAGMFTDGPPPGQPGQFAPPAQQSPDAAQAALATLNQQLQ